MTADSASTKRCSVCSEPVIHDGIGWCHTEPTRIYGHMAHVEPTPGQIAARSRIRGKAVQS